MKYPTTSHFRTFRISPQAHDWLHKRATANGRSSTAEAYMVFEVLSKFCHNHKQSLITQLASNAPKAVEERV